MRRSVGVEPLQVVPAFAVEVPDGPAWLIENLWGEQAVGILGGAPKSGKTWLALELALAVASGQPALEHFAVPRAGPVLLFAAEDSPPMVRTRLEGLAHIQGVRLEDVPVHLILASRLRLDTPDDQGRLADAVRKLRPRLLVLDPFVRIYGSIDENQAGDVARILGYLRELSRTHDLSILVVHHTRKAAGAAGQGGLSLRGSGDFYAWTDESLTLRKHKGQLLLDVEHRHAPSPEPLPLELRGGDEDHPPHLAIGADGRPAEGIELHEQIIEVLGREDGPVTQDVLRSGLHVRMQRLVDALRLLEQQGRAARSAAGWSLT